LNRKRARHQISLPYSSTALPSIVAYLPYVIDLDILQFGRLVNDKRIVAGLGRNEPTRARSRVDVRLLLGNILQLLTDLMRCRPGVSIDMLPDDVLLSVFDFCVIIPEVPLSKEPIEVWQSLVHTCRRWRSVVFGSPRRLNLRLACTNKTPVRDVLDVWPPLPLVIDGSTREGVDNIITALERKDRVDGIQLFDVNGPPSEKLLAAMQEPFPELRHLLLISVDETGPVLPDSFLGRSAPRLGFLRLFGVPFPGLPNLLLSATHLVDLHLSNVPHSGYISPEAVVTALSTLTDLESLSLEFLSPRSHPDWAMPLTRSVLPVLRHFRFKGVCEYLDNLVAHVDAPRLNELSVTFFNDIVFHTPQFVQFIRRTPSLETLKNARVVFADRNARVHFSSKAPNNRLLNMVISCSESDWQVSSLEQVCTLCLPPLSTTEDLYIYQDPYLPPHWQDNIDNTLWLELLLPFATVKNLYLCKEFAPRIGPALQDLVGSRTMEVLPTLQNIFSEELQSSGPVQEGIGKFVAARQLSGHSITISPWERVQDQVSVLVSEADD
jgi:hypothetical protein